MKIYLLITLVILIMIIAVGVAKQYKERVNFYVEFDRFINDYEINISFKKDKILCFLNSINTTSRFKLVIDKLINFIKNNEKISLEDIKILTDEERNYLESFLNKLGTNDYENEIRQLKVYKSYIGKKIEETTNLKNKVCPLIIKLSLLFALALFIIFI